MINTFVKSGRCVLMTYPGVGIIPKVGPEGGEVAKLIVLAGGVIPPGKVLFVAEL